MNREQKTATIEALVAQIEQADAVFAVDYRGISVSQAAELRAKLREADATFRVVKNSLTERAADQAGVQTLKPLLEGPTALTFVRGDTALAAKAIADYARATQLLPFKGGLLDGSEIDADQIRAISRLPAREVLYGQLVGIVASPVSGLVRTLSALVSGLAVALGQVREQKESGAIPAGEPPAAAEAEADTAPAEAEAGTQAETLTEAEAETLTEAEAEAAGSGGGEGGSEGEQDREAEEALRARAKGEPEQADAEPAQDDDNEADASAEEPATATSGGEPAEATKED
jgi:large subunit ribosomal protein L10